MALTDLVQERRRDVLLAAAARWQARADARTTGLAAVASAGPGAADSPMKQARFAARRQALSEAAALRIEGRLPVFLERKIGPTLDFLGAAPSEAARLAGRPVARIVASVDPRVEPQAFATGFLVHPRLLLTNWHVFPDVGSVANCGANFLHEQGHGGIQVGPTFALDGGLFYLSDERLDYALVGVAPRAVGGEDLSGLGTITPTDATAKILVGQPIEIIQYPDGGPKEYAISNNRLVDVLEEGFLHYETDTLEGSSGSPAFSAAWELVALHHAGIPEVRDGRIMTTDGQPWSEGMGDDRVHWIANEGIRISAIVRSLSQARMGNGMQAALLRELLGLTTDPADDVARIVETASKAPVPVGTEAATRSRQVGATTEGIVSGIVFNFTGPVTISVQSPTAGPAGGPSGLAAAAVSAPEKTLRFDPDYEHREGYDPRFLGEGLTVPLPTVSDERRSEMYAVDGEIVILPYHHYSLAMNRARRLQMWSAANVDYDPALRQQAGRASFGTDRWIGDPRIPAAVQLSDPEFYGPAGQIDRGHIVRREDSAWGADPVTLEFANSDTFHWTNCTPQHAAFNRESPPSGQYGGQKGLWGAFEGYVQKQLRDGDTRACILAGPVLAAGDPVADFGAGPIAYPIDFWKVVVVAAAAEGGAAALRVFGFVLSQKDVVDRFGIEFTPGQYARYQRPLPEIAAMSGVVFAPVLVAADTAARAG